MNNLEEISSLEEVREEFVESFFLPKLTDEELELVEKKDKENFMTYAYGLSADVDEEEMKKSDSKDKYVHGECRRDTRVLNLDDIFSETSSKFPSSFTSECLNATSADYDESDQIVDQIGNPIVNSTNLETALPFINDGGISNG